MVSHAPWHRGSCNQDRDIGVDALRRIAAPTQHSLHIVTAVVGTPYLARIGERIDNTETFARNLAARDSVDSGCAGG